MDKHTIEALEKEIREWYRYAVVDMEYSRHIERPDTAGRLLRIAELLGIQDLESPNRPRTRYVTAKGAQQRF